MTREEAIKEYVIPALKHTWNDKINKEVLEALEQEPTTKNDLAVDLISRKTVIDELKRYFHDEYYQRTSIQDCRDCFIEDVLNHLPSVTSQEPGDKCEVTFKDDNVVSRLSVRDIIYANAYEIEYPDGSSEYVVNRDELFKYLMELPPVYAKMVEPHESEGI